MPNKRAAQSVQELHSTWEYAFSPGVYSGTLDIPFAWQGLRSLSIGVESPECLHVDGPFHLDDEALMAASKAHEFTYTFKSAQKVTSYFRLRQVFELPMLRSLKFQCHGGTYPAKQMGCKSEDIFANLVSLASAEANRKSADLSYCSHSTSSVNMPF